MNKPALSPELRRWRFFALGLGVGFMLWLPFEDTGVGWIAIFAAALGALASARCWIAYAPFQGSRWLLYPIIGAAAGLALTPVGLFLMAFKSGIHGHGAPDFTPEQVLWLIQRTPIWFVSGLLTGAGWGILTLARKNRPE